MDTGALAGLLAVAVAAPVLPNARCRGGTLHDPRGIGELLGQFRHRHARAIEACRSCPERARCAEWLAGLPERDRPGGCIVAGELVPEFRLPSDQELVRAKVRALLQREPELTNAAICRQLDVGREVVRHARAR